MLKQAEPTRAERRAALKAWRKQKRTEGEKPPKFRDVWGFYQEKKLTSTET